MKNPPSITDLLTKDKAERVAKCKETIDKALIDFNCSLEVAMLVKANGNFPVVQVNANEPKS